MNVQNIIVFGTLLLASEFLLTFATLEEELTLTRREKLRLDEFRKRVVGRLPHDWMKEDIYLVTWLRARNFDLRGAEAMLMENVKWRRENRIDNILNEDWSDYEREYRYEITGCDREGRPVVSVYVGEWDVRKAVIAGESRKMMRYFDKYFEEMSVMVRQARKEGQNVTKYTELYDMSKYTLVEQGCPLCIPLYIYLFQSFESHYPASSYRTMLIKTPGYFQSLWQILQPFMSEQTRKGFYVLSRNRNEWAPVVNKYIDPSQIIKEYGGELDKAFDIDDLRRTKSTFDCSKKLV